MAEEDEDKPWAEQNLGEKSVTVLGYLIGGTLTAALIAGYLALAMQAVVESRWAFTNVSPERVCAPDERHDCMVRLPGTVSSRDGATFSVTVERRPYSCSLGTLRSAPPAPGSQVVVETWNSRLVSIVDPQRGRRRAEEWPRKWHDLSEAAAALVVVLGVPGLVALVWVMGRREEKLGPVSEPHAQT